MKGRKYTSIGFKSEDSKSYDEFTEKHYPFIEPCINCYYWRGSNTGTTCKESGYRTASVMCHYHLYTGELKEKNEIYKTGKCAYFKERGKNERT